MLEFLDWIVAEVSSLVTFIAFNSDSNMSRLYHIDVIGTVANWTSKSIWIILHDKLNDLSFLVGWTSIDNYALAQFEEVV